MINNKRENEKIKFPSHLKQISRIKRLHFFFSFCVFLFLLKVDDDDVNNLEKEGKLGKQLNLGNSLINIEIIEYNLK